MASVRSPNVAETMRVLFRTESRPEMGLGHLMRCRALADALTQRGASVEFVTPHDTVGSVGDAHATRDAARGATWLVIDGYAFDDAFVEALGRPLECDFTVRGHLHFADHRDARRASGPMHALVRASIVAARDARDVAGNAVGDARAPIVATFGGADPTHHTELFLDAPHGSAGVAVAA